MQNTKIEWCDSTWNPVTGCLHGCEYCYARKVANRFGGWRFTQGMLAMNIDEDKTYIAPVKKYYGEAKETEYGKIAEITLPFLKENRSKAPYPFGFIPTFHRYKMGELQKWKKPSTIFVCSMADLFGEWVPDEWIEEVFAACEKAPQHRYLFLTKNPIRYEQLHQKGILRKSGNMWYGYSSTKSKCDYWFDSQYNVFASVEPILEPLNLLPADWIIIGAETGNRKNKVIPRREWVDNIVRAAEMAEIPVFMKESLVSIIGEENMRREFPWKTEENRS